MRSSALALAMLASFALLASLIIGAQVVRATDVGTIAIFKTMCDNFGEQDTCNGRDTSLAGWHIDYTVQPSDGDNGWLGSIQTITVTLGENAGGGGDTGGGSQGRAQGDPVAAGTYLVCEVPEAYNDAEPPDTVPLDPLPRPEAGNGGSSGGPQTQSGDNCIIVDVTSAGTSELKFLDQQLPLIPPLVPTLVIEKAADAEVITISGAVGAQTASPSTVTWTLTYTLTNGPVTGAVITDVVPNGFTFLSAANGGTLGVDGKTVTWDLGDLTASGSVSFQTTVDVATISRSAPTVNVATIDSDQTEPDSGQDSVTVSVTAPPLAGNPTPTPAAQVPNTAMGPIGAAPTVLIALVLLGSLGGLAWTNLAGTSRRRR
jgi:hypothetical protein